MRPSRLKMVGLIVAWVFGLGASLGQGETAGGSLNRLARESSPYLRLHAANPVDWYPWGEEAIERARREDKPIFLSVGYSTCYWCHVMERSVFSDPAIAELMNRSFVNVKVDREERPDLDEIYMTATQILTGRGGWLNSVFLTPNLEPFFAGTYFPPADQGGRSGFPTVLTTIGRAWGARRDQIETQAKRLSEAVQKTLSPRSAQAGGELPLADALRAVADLKNRFDPHWGGFGEAPKFPSPANLFLLWWRGENGDQQARGMVLETLAAMGRGAIYDQLDGGFHRYTLDRAWRIPHFEKMLYDNALLAEILVMTSAGSGDADLERLARETLEFLLRVMRLPNGAFKSAIDAETAGVEGAFYVWDRGSLDRVLGREDSDFLAPILGYDSSPNFDENAYTLYLTDSFDRQAERLRTSRSELVDRVESLLDKLARDRAQRPFPLVDEKVLTDWNGMAIAALAQAGRLLGENRYTSAAVEAAEFILGLQDVDGRLLHVWNEGQAKQLAFLDDYSFLIHGLLALHRATGTARWLAEAERLTLEMERQLSEPSGRYFTSPADPALLVRSSSASGGAIPAGNGVAIVNLLELAELTGRPIYRARARSAIQSLAPELNGLPAAMPTVAQAVLMADHERADAGRATPADEPEPSLAETLVTEKLRLLPVGSEDGWRRFELALCIREGWHINANPASLEFLIPTQIKGDLQAVHYPPGTSCHPAFGGEELKVYDGNLKIEGEVSIRNPRVRVTYQACDDRRCLPPVTREVLPTGGGLPEWGRAEKSEIRPQERP